MAFKLKFQTIFIFNKMQRKEDIGEEAMEPTKPQNTSEDANESEKFKQKNKKLSKKSLEKLKAEHERKGVVYISRIPPHMVRITLSRSFALNLCMATRMYKSREAKSRNLHHCRNHKNYGIC